MNKKFILSVLCLFSQILTVNVSAINLLFSNEVAKQVSSDFVIDVQNNYTDIGLKFGDDVDAKINFNRTNDEIDINRDLNLNHKELKNSRIENFATEPTCDGTMIGREYFNTTENIIYFCDGTAWNLISSSEAIKLWDAGTVYEAGDYVLYDGSVFKVEQTTTAGDNPRASNKFIQSGNVALAGIVEGVVLSNPSGDDIEVSAGRVSFRLPNDSYNEIDVGIIGYTLSPADLLEVKLFPYIELIGDTINLQVNSGELSTSDLLNGKVPVGFIEISGGSITFLSQQGALVSRDLSIYLYQKALRDGVYITGGFAGDNTLTPDRASGESFYLYQNRGNPEVHTQTWGSGKTYTHFKFQGDGNSTIESPLDLDPTLYESAQGVFTAVPSSDYVVIRVYQSQNGNLITLYPSKVFDTGSDEAKFNEAVSSFVEGTDLSDGINYTGFNKVIGPYQAKLQGAFIVRGDGTELIDSDVAPRVKFVTSPDGGGASSGVVILPNSITTVEIADATEESFRTSVLGEYVNTAGMTADFVNHIVGALYKIDNTVLNPNQPVVYYEYLGDAVPADDINHYQKISSDNTQISDIDGDTKIETDNSDDDIIKILTQGTERLRIDATGKLGIGDIDPLVKLDLGGLLGGLFRLGDSDTATTLETDVLGSLAFDYANNNGVEYYDGTDWNSLNKSILNNYADGAALIADQTNQIEGGLYRLNTNPPQYYEYLGNSNSLITDYDVVQNGKTILRTYLTNSALFGDQANQVLGGIYKSREFGTARYVYLGTTNGNLTDYDLLSHGRETDKSIFQLDSTTKGFLPPRMNDTERDAITGLGVADEGLQIFNTDIKRTQTWDGVAWTETHLFNKDADVNFWVVDNPADGEFFEDDFIILNLTATTYQLKKKSFNPLFTSDRVFYNEYRSRGNNQTPTQSLNWNPIDTTNFRNISNAAPLRTGINTVDPLEFSKVDLSFRGNGLPLTYTIWSNNGLIEIKRTIAKTSSKILAGATDFTRKAAYLDLDASQANPSTGLLGGSWSSFPNFSNTIEQVGTLPQFELKKGISYKLTAEFSYLNVASGDECDFAFVDIANLGVVLGTTGGVDGGEHKRSRTARAFITPSEDITVGIEILKSSGTYSILASQNNGGTSIMVEEL